MIYVYLIRDWDFRATDEEIEAMKRRNIAIENCKELKKMHDEDYDDEYAYIGKNEFFISDGNKYFANYTLDDWIERNSNTEEASIDTSTLFIYSFEFSNEAAIEVLTDELKREDSDFDYLNRIFNSDDPYTEIRNIIDDITFDLLELTIEEIGKQIRVMKKIDWN